MDAAQLNHALAVALGYVYAGEMRGRSWYHPPGTRTRVVPLPQYTHDWNILMPLVLWSPGMLEVLVAAVEAGTDDLRHALCQALLRRTLGVSPE